MAQNLSSSPTTYSGVTRAFHWLTAIAVLLAFISGEGGSVQRVFAEQNRDALVLHETLGMAVFTLTLLRLLWRTFDRQPLAVPMPQWMTLAANLTHFGLYALLLGIPASAIIGSGLTGHGVFIFLAGEFALSLPEMMNLGRWTLEIHTLLGDAIMWLAGIHAAAAIFHHYVLADDVLRSMLPEPIMALLNRLDNRFRRLIANH